MLSHGDRDKRIKRLHLVGIDYEIEDVDNQINVSLSHGDKDKRIKRLLFGIKRNL